MERTGLKPEEREAVKEWAGDERWVKREAWKADEASGTLWSILCFCPWTGITSMAGRPAGSTASGFRI